MQLTLTQEIVASIVGVVVSFAVIQGAGFAIKSFAKRAGVTAAQLQTISDVVTVVWLVVAATAILSITGLASEFTTLTLSGIVGVAISLALQSTLSNMISGFLLFHDKAIRLNDEIQFSGIKGKVVQIGLRATWVKTTDGNIAVIGNSNLSSGPLVNYTSKERLSYLGEQVSDSKRT